MISLTPFGMDYDGKTTFLTAVMLLMHSSIKSCDSLEQNLWTVNISGWDCYYYLSPLSHVKYSFRASHCIGSFSTDFYIVWWYHTQHICILVRSYVLLLHIWIYSLIFHYSLLIISISIVICEQSHQWRMNAKFLSFGSLCTNKMHSGCV